MEGIMTPETYEEYKRQFSLLPYCDICALSDLITCIKQTSHVKLFTSNTETPPMSENIQDLQTTLKICRIQSEVKKKGYYCSPKFRGEIEGLYRLRLPYCVQVTKGCITAVNAKQPAWVDALSFKYEPKQYDPYSYNELGAYMNITVYYDNQKYKRGKRIITENGNVDNIEIVHGDIMCRGKCIRTSEESGDFKFLIIS